MSHNTFHYRVLALGLLGAVLCMTPVMAAEKPVTNLKKALKSGKREILFTGKESDDITIKKGIAVVGTDPAKAVIYGDVKMENGASLSNVTVSAKRIGIEVAKGASVTLSNVTVRNATDSGIFAPEGGGTLSIKNSRIIKNRKGFYILPGKNLNISGSVISENQEEGMDIRAGVSGTLSGNQFTNNREGGAELIAGSANLKLVNNTFSGNKASGLAIQSYRGSGKRPGSVVVQSNTFSGNGEHGINCLSPSGGGGGRAFYQATIKAIDNTFRGNGEAAIAPECGVSNRSSAVAAEKKEDQTPEAFSVTDPKILQEEFRQYFSLTVGLLHDREFALEESLRDLDQATPWGKRLFRPVISGVTQEYLVEEIAKINELRTTLAQFPEEWLDEAMQRERDQVVGRSLERMEELRQYFEHLQKPMFQFHLRTQAE